MDWIENEVNKREKINFIKSKSYEFWEKLLLFNDGLPQEIRRELGPFYFADEFILIDNLQPWRKYDLEVVLLSYKRRAYVEYDYDDSQYYL